MAPLRGVGLDDLIATTPDEYVAAAVRLAGDLTRLAELRSSLRERLRRSPLMDAPGFTHALEAAYLQMWQRKVGCKAVVKGRSLAGRLN